MTFHHRHRLAVIASVALTLFGASLARAESPIVEDNARITVATLHISTKQLHLDKEANDCVLAIQPESFFAVFRQVADARFSAADQAQVNDFLRSPAGQKHTQRGMLLAHRAARQPLPEPLPEFTPEDRKELERVAGIPAVNAYLSGGLTSSSESATTLNARIREVAIGCKVVPNAAAAPASAPAYDPAPDYTPGAVASESRDAALAGIGAQNFIVGRLSRDCLPVMKRSETPKEFVSAWQQRNAHFVAAAAHYQAKRLSEASALGGKAKADAVMASLMSTVRKQGESTVQSLLQAPDATAACTRIMAMLDAGELDLRPGFATPEFHEELQALLRWSQANP